MANSKIFVPTNEVQHLRSSIRHLVEQHNRTNSKLIGVQVLTDQLEQKTQECERYKATIQQLEVLLSRAENRIAQLSVKGGSAKGGIVTPGISKRLFESIARENTKLKIALEHVVNKQPNGIELAVENRDLHELVIALKAELEQNRKETEELRDALKAVESEDTMTLQEQVARLTAQITQLERSLKGKQVYCEGVVRENERLQANLEAVKSDRVTQLASLRKMAGDNPAVKEVLELAWTGEDNVDNGPNKEIEKYTKEIESLKKQVEELKGQRTKSYEESKKHIEGFTRQIQELTNMNTMQSEEMDKMKGQLDEANMIKELLEQQCKGYENDFKMERQEKLKLDADIKNILKQCEEQKQENKAIRRENENIKRMIKEEFERKQHKQTSPTTPAAPQQRVHQWPTNASTAVTQHAYQWPTSTSTAATQRVTQWSPPTTAAAGYAPPHFPRRAEQVVADCTRSTSEPKSSCLMCPICHCILPPDEMEDHLNDCDRRS